MYRSRSSSQQALASISQIKDGQFSDSLQQIQPPNLQKYEEQPNPSYYARKQKKVEKNKFSKKQKANFRKILIQRIIQRKIHALNALKMNVERRKLKREKKIRQIRQIETEAKEKQKTKFEPQEKQQKRKLKKIAQRINTPQTLILFQKNKKNNDIEVGDQFQVFEDKNVFGNHLLQKDCRNSQGIDNDADSSYSQINQGIYYQMNKNVWKTLQNHGNEYMKNFDPPRVFYDCLFKLIHQSCIQYTNYFFKSYQSEKNLQPEIRRITKNAVLEFMKKYQSQFELVDAEELVLRGNNSNKAAKNSKMSRRLENLEK